MDLRVTARLKGRELTEWTDFLARQALRADPFAEQTVLIRENDAIIACGSRQGNLLKCIAVDPAHRGEDLTATILTTLRREAFQAGHRHLFLYTKPGNKYLFSSLFFYPVAQTEEVLLMESEQKGISRFLEKLSVAKIPTPGNSSESISSPPMIGAAVMNCNPFTLGHRYLIETAAATCDHLYVFVLSEDKSYFSAADRMEMVRRGTGDLHNVTVHPTGPYLISSATFPTYFLKDREQATQIQCRLDLEIFTKHFVPHFSITHRFVGTEELSPMTALYNEALKTFLPEKGVLVREIPRLRQSQTPVSASAVRALLEDGQTEALKNLVPETTFVYLQKNGFFDKQGGTYE